MYLLCSWVLTWTTINNYLSLTWWLNYIAYSWSDLAWNTVTWSLQIIRTPVISNISETNSWVFERTISFSLDYPSSWIVLYWTSSWNLNLSWVFLPNLTSHSINLSWLSSDTVYYYQGYWSFSGVIWESTPTKSFKTPAIISQTSSWVLSATWSAYLSGSTATWVLFTETGTLRLSNNEWLWNTNVLLNLSGLTISSSWSWDGIFYAPVVTNDTATWVESWYSFTGNVYQIGNPSVELTLSGQSATINLFVGTHLNSQTLKVYRSTNFWTTYSILTTCLVSSWICSFSSSQFSLFTVAVAIVIAPTVVNYGWGGGWGSYSAPLPIVTSSSGTTQSWITNITVTPSDTVSMTGFISQDPIIITAQQLKISKSIIMNSTLKKWTIISIYRILSNWRKIQVWKTRVLPNGKIRHTIKIAGKYIFVSK